MSLLIFGACSLGFYGLLCLVPRVEFQGRTWYIYPDVWTGDLVMKLEEEMVRDYAARRTTD